MERLSDTVTSVFRIDIKDHRPSICSPKDPTIVYGDTFGLGWRIGISYDASEWFPRVRLYLDHNHTQSERDEATVTLCLKTNADKDIVGLHQRITKIPNFGHGRRTHLGSWSLPDITAHPYISLTVTTKTKVPNSVADPLHGMTLATRQSMSTGDFVDTKFYVFSVKRPGPQAACPRIVFANSSSLRLLLPQSISGESKKPGLAPSFLVNLNSDHQIIQDSVLHAYEYESDSDLDEDEHSGAEQDFFAEELAPGSSGNANNGDGPHGSNSPLNPPSYSISTCRMILVKGVAYKTWASFVYYRYTGQVSFLPLKSQPYAPRDKDPEDPPACSPKSMYRLAIRLGDDRLKDIAFQYIKASLSSDNIVEEAFSWFTAQYPDVSKLAVEEVLKCRKIPEVYRALNAKLRAVSAGQKPWAFDVLSAIMDKLNDGVE
ncbi:hypothetical protein F5I97DRAFT_1925144 [Phlebopus sp. FC_14]|nr:hypothetical protein F5I97DRAFT_1925144 [Phlebopus sp. FC_14]